MESHPSQNEGWGTPTSSGPPAPTDEGFTVDRSCRITTCRISLDSLVPLLRSLGSGGCKRLRCRSSAFWVIPPHSCKFRISFCPETENLGGVRQVKAGNYHLRIRQLGKRSDALEDWRRVPGDSSASIVSRSLLKIPFTQRVDDSKKRTLRLIFVVWASDLPPMSA